MLSHPAPRFPDAGARVIETLLIVLRERPEEASAAYEGKNGMKTQYGSFTECHLSRRYVHTREDVGNDH